jgi:hypothetical protein
MAALGTPRLFVLWDRDPGGGVGMIADEDSTMEGGNSWADGSGSTSVIATGISHAGTSCTQTTRTSTTGTASVFWTGSAGDTVAGRTYLWCAYLLPASTARVATLSVDFRTTGGGSSAGTASASLTEVAGRWLPLLLVATAPAGSSFPILTLSYAAVPAGELHYNDTITGDDLGTEETARLLSVTTSAGRSDELDTVQAGTASFVLGNNDGRLTPGPAAPGAPYTGNVVPNRRVVLLASVGGTLYHRWTGYTTGYSQTLAGTAWSEVAVACVDAFRGLARPDMPPPYRAEVLLLDKPSTYLPLDEAQGASSAGNISGSGGSAPLLTTKYGSGGSTFGADPVLSTTSAGHTGDNDAHSINFNPASTLAKGGPADVLDLSALPGAYPTNTAPWTFAFWVDLGTDTPVWSGILYRSGLSSNNNALTGFQIEVSLSGKIVVKTASETCITSVFGYVGAGPWMFWVSYNPFAGTFGTVRLYVPGVADDTSYACTASPFSFGILPDGAFVGAAWQTLTHEATFPAKVRMANLAFWSELIGDPRATAHWAIGRFGGLGGETEGNRTGGVLNLAGWPTADTRIDVGLTTLLPRAWGPTNPLALAQATAAEGTAVVLVDAAGKIVMQNRRRRINAPSLATFAGSAGTGVEEDYTPTLDDSRIRNLITRARVGGATVTLAITSSIARFGRAAPGSSTSMGVLSDAEVAAAAQYEALRYATPDVRVAQVSITLHTASAAAALVQTFLLEQGTKITLSELPTLAPAGSVDYFVERIADSWSANKWTVTLGLSPISSTPGVHTALQLDNATLGRLDSGNALTY